VKTAIIRGNTLGPRELCLPLQLNFSGVVIVPTPLSGWRSSADNAVFLRLGRLVRAQKKPKLVTRDFRCKGSSSATEKTSGAGSPTEEPKEDFLPLQNLNCASASRPIHIVAQLACISKLYASTMLSYPSAYQSSLSFGDCARQRLLWKFQLLL
jgi:hypothetical protein